MVALQESVESLGAGETDLPCKEPKGEGVRSGSRSTTEVGLVPDRGYLEGYLGLPIQGLNDARGPVAQRDRGLDQ